MEQVDGTGKYFFPDQTINTPPQLSPSPCPAGVDQSGIDPGRGEGEGLVGSVILTPLQTSTTGRGLQTDLFWPVPCPVAPCIPDWKVFFCGCKARVAQVGCNRLDCRECADFLRKRRAVEIGERMEAGRNGKPVIYTVFTIPPDLREKAADRKTWGRWLRSLRRVLKKKFGLLYGCERVDPCGDEKPDLWHPHLNLLWVQRDGFRPFIDVDLLREEWARIIGTDDPNLWTQFSTDPVKLRHWYSYMGRTWADWRNSVPRHLTVRWIGKYPARPEIAEPVCEECGQGFDDLSFQNSTKEVAEYFCRAGPAACRAEIVRRRHVAFVASQRGGSCAPWLIHESEPDRRWSRKVRA